MDAIMPTIYDNLKQLIADNYQPARGFELVLNPNNAISIHHNWYKSDPSKRGPALATIDPDNTLQLHLTSVDSGVNLLLGRFGLGGMENGTTPKARRLYWINGVMFRYEQGMCIDLNTNTVIDGEAVADITVDKEARKKFAALVKAKTPQAMAYLKMAMPSLKRNYQAVNSGLTPARFVMAVLNDETELVATIPFLCNRSYTKYVDRGKEVSPESYPQMLKSYLAQNRAELYQAAGVAK